MVKHLTIAQAAGILNVTVQTVRAWDKAGKIKTFRTPGNQRRIPQSEIERLLGSTIDSESVVSEPDAVPYVGKVPGNSFLLMCKDNAVYDISRDRVLNEELLPGSILRGSQDYSGWMKTRYSAGSNNSARRLMLRAFGSDNHENALEVTRALSLSDCYWLKRFDEEVSFNAVTPYLHEEWDGTGVFAGGSISTLFVNGAADKRWISSSTLLKVNSYEEYEPYQLCSALGLEHTAKAEMSDDGIKLKNFTSTDYFFESMEQSGFTGYNENPREKAVELFKELAVGLFVVDYLVEHDDRHWGNYGFLRSSNTGKYVSMAPYFDFDWAWSDGVVPLPDTTVRNYKGYIRDLCTTAKDVADGFKHEKTITKRADELLRMSV